MKQARRTVLPGANESATRATAIARSGVTALRNAEHRFGRLRHGDHIVLVYDGAAEMMAFVVPFIRDGLASGARCLYVQGDLDPAEITDALAVRGVDVDRELERGALGLVSVQEVYGPPPFDALRALDHLRRKVREANADGFTGVWLAVEMTWTATMDVRGDAVEEWESLLEQTRGPDPLTVACLYQRAQFAPALLRYVIRSHAKVIAGDDVYLSLSALFQDLAATDLQALVRSAAERRVPAGGVYYHQGDPATDVYVLTSGSVKLVRTDPEGRGVVLRIVTPTEPFGHVNALGGTPRVASAEALEDSRALAWSVPTVFQVMMAHPWVSLSTIRVMAENVQEAVDRAQDLATSSVDRRLARLLLRLAESLGRKTPRGVVIRVGLSGQDLAEMIGATSYTVSRVLAEWRRLDIADVQRERILILDRQRLAMIAGEHTNGEVSRTRGRKSGANE